MRRSLTSVLIVALVGTFALVAAAPPAWANQITVTNTTDDAPSAANDGDCTLREAIHAANTDVAEDACPAGSGTDEILVPAGAYTRGVGGVEGGSALDINVGDLDITQSVTISGTGAATTVVDAQDMGRGLHVATGVTVTLSGLTVEDGTDGTGFGGGGIFNLGTLTLNQVVVRDNEANTGSGGIRNDGTLSLVRSVLAGNVAQGSSGGGLGNTQMTSTATLTNSSVYGNTAVLDGGGVWVNLGAVTMNSTTVSGNTADSDADDNGEGGGIRGSGLTLRNTIVAGNNDNSSTTVHPDCLGSFTSGGYNLIQVVTAGCSFTANNDVTGVSPILGAPADNGGPTPTLALLPGSPAIDAGNPAGCTDGTTALTTDQRGEPRPADGEQDGAARCDIGAYEHQVQAKELALKAKPRRVERGKRTRLTAIITPCVPETLGDMVEFRRGTKVLAEKALNDLCRAKKGVRVKKRTRFTAFSPADFDSLADASTKVTVKVLRA